MAKEFKDESGISGLKEKIAKAQYDPEPTKAQYINPIPINLRRTEQVMKDQMPVDQSEDKHTIAGEERAAVIKAMKLTENEYKRYKIKEKEDPGFMKKTLALLPSPSQLRLATAIASGNLSKFAMALESMERDKRTHKKDKTKKSKAELNELKAKVAKQKADAERKKKQREANKK